MIRTVLVYLINDLDGTILLGRARRGIGKGKLNGGGGKIHEGETPEQTAVREMREELSVDIDEKNLKKIAEHTFHFQNGARWHTIVYFARAWSGEPRESEEMTELQWYTTDALPYAQMWADDILWLPQVFAGNTVTAEFHFDENSDTITSYRIEGTKRA